MENKLIQKKLDAIEVKCQKCKVRSYSFCRCLNEDKLEYFSKISTEKNFTNRENVFLQHEETLNFYNITEGNVKIYQLLDDGRIQIIGFLYPGDFFGTSNQNKYTYSAEAIGNLKVCVFNQKLLDRYIDENPILAKELFNQTSYELTLAQDRMMILGKLNATEKVISFLNNISNQRKRIGWPNNPISLPMTRQDIADYLGLTIETVSREMKKLKDEKIIKILSTKQFYINDFEKLHNLN
jgi:CRP/FNR family transcriptional regulator